MEDLARALSTPTFDLQKTIYKMFNIPFYLNQNFLSYVLKMAADNKEYEEKYAKVFDELFKPWSNSDLWNENNMWKLAYSQSYYFPKLKPLHVSIENDLTKIAALILQRGKEFVHEQDGRSNTALHYAQSPQAVELLLAHGAHINAQNSRGETPLHLAPISLVPFLLGKGADIGIKDKDSAFFHFWNYYWGKQSDDRGDRFDEELSNVVPDYKTYPEHLKDLKFMRKTDPSNIEVPIYIDEKGNQTYFAYSGLTPLMKAIACHKDSQRLRTFLDHALRSDVLKQMGSLTVLATFSKDPKYLEALNDFKGKVKTKT